MRREETPSPPLLEVKELTVACQGKTVIRDICFSLKKGEILGIVGESGSGKSTILKAVMGILGEEYTITKGEILYKGNNQAGEKKDQRTGNRDDFSGYEGFPLPGPEGGKPDL